MKWKRLYRDYRTLIQLNASQIVGFSSAGAAGVLVDLGTYNLVLLASGNSSVSNLTGALCGLVANFTINMFVFSNRSASLRERARHLTKYALVAGASSIYLVLAFEIYLDFVGTNGFQDSVVRVLIVLSGSLVRFLLTRSWIFE